jgi:hypothetical protein
MNLNFSSKSFYITNGSTCQFVCIAEHLAVASFKADPDVRESQLLTMKKNDVIVVVEALDSGWWLGCHGDQVGWFPGDRLEVNRT